jgi:hypothetical protein
LSCALDSYDFTGPWGLEAGSQTWLVRPPSRRSTRPIRLLVLLLGSVCAEALPLRLCEYTNIWCTQSIGCSSVKICSPRLRRNRCGHRVRHWHWHWHWHWNCGCGCGSQPPPRACVPRGFGCLHHGAIKPGSCCKQCGVCQRAEAAALIINKLSSSRR